MTCYQCQQKLDRDPDGTVEWNLKPSVLRIQGPCKPFDGHGLLSQLFPSMLASLHQQPLTMSSADYYLMNVNVNIIEYLIPISIIIYIIPRKKKHDQWGKIHDHHLFAFL